MKGKYRRLGYYTSILGMVAFMELLITGCNRKLVLQEDNRQIKEWRQQEFILSTFHALGGDTARYDDLLTKTRDAGINLVELTFLSPEQLAAALRAAERAGVQVLAEDLSSISGIADKYPAFSEETVRDAVNALKGSPALAGYYIWDEPHEKDFHKTRELRDWVKKYDEKRLAFSVIFPSYGVYTWEKGDYQWSDNSYPRYVDNYLKIVDPEVMSFDYYPFRANRDSTNLLNSDMWRDFGYIRKKAIVYNKPLWFYFQAIGMQEGEKSIMDIPRISAQMYAALAYGVKGLSYYNSAGSLLDGEGNRTTLYEGLKLLNGNIRYVGDFLLDKQSEYIYHTGIAAGNDALYYLDAMADSDLLEDAPANLVIGVFKGTGRTRYILVANKDHLSETNGELRFRQPVDMDIMEPAAQRNATRTVIRNKRSVFIHLPAGAGALYIIKKH